MNEIEGLKARIAELERGRDELQERACDECLDGSPDEFPNTYGWNHNRVEGWHACGCIEESGPYQQLLQRAEKAEAEIVYYKKRESIFEAHTLNAIKDCEKAEAELNRVMNDLPDVHHIKWECGCVGRYPSTSCQYCHVKAMQKKRNEDHEAELEKWRK